MTPVQYLEPQNRKKCIPKNSHFKIHIATEAAQDSQSRQATEAAQDSQSWQATEATEAAQDSQSWQGGDHGVPVAVVMVTVALDLGDVEYLVL